ncbi:MAG: ribonuclease III [Hyphomicrobiales bacterium]
MEFKRVEGVLGHTFADPALLDRALTHASHGGGQSDANKTYQRLEFLGDRVLALVIADALIARFPSADEGELARRLNHLVRAETCAAIAKQLGLDRDVRTDDLDVTKPTRAARAVLADVCEALIAALFLDGGMEVAKRFILTHWRPVMDEAGAARRDPKTALQEWAHSKRKATPTYTEVGRDGPDHAPVFKISVSVDGIDPLEAQGKSKRDAQQAAAMAMLVREGVWKPDNDRANATSC